jgi:hypothetical protein
MCKDLHTWAFILGLHAEEAAEGAPVSFLKVPGLGEKSLAAQLPYISGIDAVNASRYKIIRQSLVEASLYEVSNGFVCQRRRSCWLCGFSDQAEQACGEACTPKFEHLEERWDFRRQTVETVGIVYEAVLRAGIGLGGED